MKFLILALALTFSSTSFARQYIQCSELDINSTEVMVVNLPTEKGGTLFLSSGMQNPEDERLLVDIQLEKIENFQLSNISNNGVGGSEMNAKLKSCLICREASKDPYAARCGHICCYECWQQWFKVRKACVICRTEVAPNSIVKITIVK
jgi:hypothetical protein